MGHFRVHIQDHCLYVCYLTCGWMRALPGLLACVLVSEPKLNGAVTKSFLCYGADSESVAKTTFKSAAGVLACLLRTALFTLGLH